MSDRFPPKTEFSIQPMAVNRKIQRLMISDLRPVPVKALRVSE
jgi:hypothetical protein